MHILKRYQFFVLMTFLFSHLSAQEVELNEGLLNNYREEVNLITDRNIFIAGERIWFYSCLSSNQDSVLSKTLYLELYNGEKVIQQKFSVEKGYCKGYLQIPDDFHSSGYFLRAYTKFMKNFLPENYAYQVIMIVNTENGIVKNHNKETSHKILPKNFCRTDNSYSLFLDSNSVNSNILEIEEYKDHFKFKFLGGDEFCNSKKPKVLIRNSKFQVISNLELQKDNYKISNETLTDGINYYTVCIDSIPLVLGILYKPFYNSKGTNERKIFTKTRTEIQLPNFNDKDFDPFIISISRKGTRFSHRDTAFAFKLLAENPYLINSFYQIFPGIESIPNKYILLLLRNHTLAVTQNKEFMSRIIHPEFEYIPEIYDLSIEGVVKSKKENKPISDKLIYLSVFGKENQLHVYNTTDKGSFIFNIENMTGLRNAYLTTDAKLSGEVEIMVKNSFSSDFYPSHISMMIDTSYLGLVEDMYLAHQINEVFNTNDTVTLENFRAIPSVERFGNRIKLKDFIKLPTLIDVFREIIPNVSIRKRKGKHAFTVIDGLRLFVYDYPLILLDNIPIFNDEVILSLDPDIIEDITVVNEPIYLGDYKIEGLISIKTINGDFGEIDFFENSTFLKYPTYSPLADFVQILPQPTNIPHFSNTLFWNVVENNASQISVKADDGVGIYDCLIYLPSKNCTLERYYYFDIELTK